MRKLVVVVMLGSLGFPYARAPLCQAGAHEHPEPSVAFAEGERPDTHQAHGKTGAETPDPMSWPTSTHPLDDVLRTVDGGQDCHEQMRCDVAADVLVSPPLVPDATVALGPTERVAALDSESDGVRRLDLPPPRRI